MTWQLTLVGLLTGLLVGMTGMGGGSLMTPLLVFLFGVPPTTAIGTDIGHGAVFKTVSAVQHRRMGNVRARLAGWMLLGSAALSLGGVWCRSRIATGTASMTSWRSRRGAAAPRRRSTSASARRPTR